MFVRYVVTSRRSADDPEVTAAVCDSSAEADALADRLYRDGAYSTVVTAVDERGQPVDCQCAQCSRGSEGTRGPACGDNLRTLAQQLLAAPPDHDRARRLARETLRYLAADDDAGTPRPGLPDLGTCQECGHPVAEHGASGACWSDVLSWLGGRIVPSCPCRHVYP